MTDWPDVEVELIAWLKPRFPSAVFASETDNDLLDNLPFVQVTRADGDDDGVRLDRALVDIDVYGGSRGAASTLARQIRSALLDHLCGTQSAAAVFGRTSTVSAPSWRPRDNTDLRRSGATYEIYLRPAA